MTKVIQLRAEGQLSESEKRMAARYGVTPAELRAAIKSAFLLMHDHGMGSLTIEREGAKAVVTIDGQRM